MGTLTGFNGKFVADVKKGEYLTFSYVGFKNREIKYTGEKPITVVLPASHGSLDEVVTVGYSSKNIKIQGVGSKLVPEGTQEKKAIVGAVKGVEQKRFEGKPFASELSQSKNDLQNVETRKKLQETAFFLPHLKTSANGEIRFSFESPEALTRWRFQAFAHDKHLYQAKVDLSTITQKN